MAVIEKLVRMDADDFDNVLDLDNALYASADAIRTIYGALAQATGKQAYATAAAAQYEFKSGTGFQDAILDVADALNLEAGSYYGIPDLDGRKVAVGTFTLTANASSYTITHGLGETPVIIAIFNVGFNDADVGGGGGHNQYLVYDTKRVTLFRVNSSDTIQMSSPSRSTIDANSTTFKAAGGYTWVKNIAYFWMALGAKASS